MARTGPGIYELPPIYEAVPGETVLAEQHNAPLEDIAQDLNTPRPVIAGGTGADSGQGALDNLFDNGAFVRDSRFIVADTDNLTRKARLDVGNVTPGQTRVIKVPDRNGTLVTGPETTVDNTVPRFDGVTGNLQTSGALVDDNGNFETTSTDSNVSSVAPAAILRRNYSTPGTVGAYGSVQFRGTDSAGNDTIYGRIQSAVTNGTDGSEASSLTFVPLHGGAAVQAMQVMGDRAVIQVPIVDTATIGDNGDLTKRLRFEASGVTAGQTRVLSAPDRNGTLMTGPTTTVDNTVPRFDGTSGNIQTSGVTIDDANILGGVSRLNIANTGLATVQTVSDLNTGNIRQELVFGKNSAATNIVYGDALWQIGVNTAGAEVGSYVLRLRDGAGNLSNALSVVGNGSIQTYRPLNTSGGFANPATVRTQLGFSANGSSLVTAADYAAMRNLLSIGEELIGIYTPSGVSSVDVTGLSAFRSIKIQGILAPATDDVSLVIRTSSNNGSSYDAGASDYSGLNAYATGSNNFSSAAYTTSGMFLTNVGVGNASGEMAHFDVLLGNFNKAEPGEFLAHTYFVSAAGSGYRSFNSGRRAQSTARNALRFLFSSGNIASGYIVVTGIRG